MGTEAQAFEFLPHAADCGRQFGEFDPDAIFEDDTELDTCTCHVGALRAVIAQTVCECCNGTADTHDGDAVPLCKKCADARCNVVEVKCGPQAEGDA